MASDRGWHAREDTDGPVKHQSGDGGVSEGDPENGPSESKKPRLEDNPSAPSQTHSIAPREEEEEREGEASETQEPRDPGKKQYRELSKHMRQLRALVSKPEEERGNDEVMTRMRDLAKKIENMCTSAVHDGEVPNPVKLIQMHLKYVLFNSEKVKDGDNIKNFLSGLEDGSASTSDKDSSVFVFLANFATELWYSWNDKESQWQWTPEKWTEERKWWLWMPCSTTVVTAGQWKNETPAPENVEIIKYLDAIRPVPSDEQYLPPSFDVAELLRKLVESGAGDGQLRGSVKVILQEITSQSVASRSSHVLAFLEEMSKLLQELAVDDQPQ